MKDRYNYKFRKRIVFILLGVIYLYLSYQLKVVRGYNSGYKQLGMSDIEIIVGSILIIMFILKELYNKWKLNK